MKKKIVFVTGTRADYGKLKSIIYKVQKNKNFTSSVFVTGMHNQKKFGNTFNELITDNIKNIFRYKNIIHENQSMDIILANTIKGFNKYILKIKPDLVVLHGDRVETLACAICACLNNVRIAHLEGGEVSGTVDEILRHSITKLSHIHLVTNLKAKKRLVQMGENKKSIYVIGSPDIDIMQSKNLPSLQNVLDRYKIKFKKYAIAIFHPVTTELKNLKKNLNTFVKILKKKEQNYILIYPNNDSGHELILNEYKKISNFNNIKLLPSIRFERYLSLLKNAEFIIGNSSSGIIEAPIFGIPTIDLGNRQLNRANIKSIKNHGFNFDKIIKSIKDIKYKKFKKSFHFGKGNSDKLFVNLLKKNIFWKVSNQKQFKDLKFK
jgi:UDP-N-acetylglucosamine 2-epimerase (hydrolysing)